MIKRMSPLIVLSILTSTALSVPRPYFSQIEQAIAKSDFPGCQMLINRHAFTKEEFRSLRDFSGRVRQERYNRFACPGLAGEDKSDITRGVVLGTTGIGATAVATVVSAVAITFAGPLALIALPITLGASCIAGIGYKSGQWIRSGCRKKASKKKYEDAYHINLLFNDMVKHTA
jgi:hypothetical protein